MNSDRLYLAQILEAIGYIEQDIGGGQDVFLSDRRVRQAILLNLQIIGEAVKRLSQTTRELAPHIPWRMIAGLRDALVHNYDGVNPHRIWDIAQTDIPRLRSTISALASIVESQSKDEASADDAPPVQ